MNFLKLHSSSHPGGIKRNEFQRDRDRKKVQGKVRVSCHSPPLWHPQEGKENLPTFCTKHFFLNTNVFLLFEGFTWGSDIQQKQTKTFFESIIQFSLSKWRHQVHVPSKAKAQGLLFHKLRAFGCFKYDYSTEVRICGCLSASTNRAYKNKKDNSSVWQQSRHPPEVWSVLATQRLKWDLEKKQQ